MRKMPAPPWNVQHCTRGLLMPHRSREGRCKATSAVILMMQKELHSLLEVRDETNRKIRTARVTLQWLERRLDVQQSRTISFSQSSGAAEQPQERVVLADQMVEAPYAFEEAIVGT